MANKNIQIDWEDFDNRAIKDGRDRNKFSCDEQWEVDYLVKILCSHFRNISEHEIRAAISACCSEVIAPRPREEFVDCVIARLVQE